MFHGESQRRLLLKASLLVNVLLMFLLLFKDDISEVRRNLEIKEEIGDNRSLVRKIDAVWNGGHPMGEKRGSCYCGPDDYCMCSPNVAIDLVIVTEEDKVWLVERKDTNQLAVMGGFVDVGETVEDAVRREMNEEMNIDLKHNIPLQLMGVYSDPRRDNRRHTISTVFIVHLPNNIPPPRAGDDAKSLKLITLDEIEQNTYFADHKTILMDFKRLRKPSRKLEAKNDGDFAVDIQRSTCIATAA